MEMDHKRYLIIGTDSPTADALCKLLGQVENYSFRSAVIEKKDVGFFTGLNRIEIEELDRDELKLLEEHAKDRQLEVLTALY